jgi:hypothetical protein
MPKGGTEMKLRIVRGAVLAALLSLGACGGADDSVCREAFAKLKSCYDQVQNCLTTCSGSNVTACERYQSVQTYDVLRAQAGPSAQCIQSAATSILSVNLSPNNCCQG